MYKLYISLSFMVLFWHVDLLKAQELEMIWSTPSTVVSEFEFNNSKDVNDDGIRDIKIKRLIDINNVGIRYLSGNDRDLIVSYIIPLEGVGQSAFREATISLMNIKLDNKKVAVVHASGSTKIGMDQSHAVPVYLNSIIHFPDYYRFMGFIDHNNDDRDDLVFYNFEKSLTEIWELNE